MTRTLLTLARFSLIEAMRSRIGWLVIALLGIGASLAWFAGQVAITETSEIQTVLTASFLRFVAVFLISAFVINSQARETADKGLDVLLSLPIPRTAYYLGKLLGYLAGAWLLAITFGLALLFLGSFTDVVVWTVSLGLELSIVAAASLFFVTTLAQVPVALMAIIGFYLLSRAMAAFRLIGGSALIDDGALMPKVIQHLLDAIAAILPRLDLYTQSTWLAEHVPSPSILWSLAGQALIYVILLSAAGLVDLYRKNF
ncbi:MAG: ABC transporter permease subunit [Pseudomonadota bacterium]